MPNQELHQQSYMVDGEATATFTATVPTQGHSDPRSPQVQQGRVGYHSLLAKQGFEQIKSGPLSSSYLEICRDAAWKNSKIWKCNGSEKMSTKD